LDLEGVTASAVAASPRRSVCAPGTKGLLLVSQTVAQKETAIMWLAILRNRLFGPQAPRPPARRRARLRLERLEDRSLPSAYTAASVADLVADINAANQHGGANTITLAANSPFVLTAVDNTTDGATGLPVITKGSLTLVGNGDTLERSTASATPAFRLFDVANGAALTLMNLTLQNGRANGAGSAADGGAIYSQGSLVLNGVLVQSNSASGSEGKYRKFQSGPGGDAAGGGIWSDGALTLENGTTVQNNVTFGGAGGATAGGPGGPGGNAFGGGVYVAGGTANLTGVTLSNNAAIGEIGGSGPFGYPVGPPGNGFGGGLYVAAGTVSLSTVTVTGNGAENPYSGGGAGGGVYIAAGATVSLDAFTVAHITNNTAAVGPNIYGSYILLS
jgi:hypothetical protein